MVKTQSLLSPHEDNIKKFYSSRSKRNFISAIIMIIVSSLPYADFFLDIFIDTKSIQVPRFQNLSYAMWAYGSAISPILVLATAKILRPVWWTYFVTIYVNVSAIIAYIYLQLNINIDSDFIFRLINFIFSLILLIILRRIYLYYKLLSLKEDIMEEFIKNRNDYEKEN